MSTATEVNPYEIAGRLTKAHKIARFLEHHCAEALAWHETFGRVADMPDDWWADVAKRAGVKPPSRATIELVVDILAEGRAFVHEQLSPLEGLGDRRGPHA